MATPKIHVESASTLAVIASAYEPLLLLDDQLAVIAASASFCRAFHVDPLTVVDTPLSQIGAGAWKLPQLAALLRATASGSAEVQAYEMDLLRDGEKPRRLVLNAHKLAYGDDEPVRLLVAVIDVTDARAAERLKDDLLRDKAMLLQEMQHRVANSLQIIASILMQSARKMQSEESRGHLQDAHSRVLSIASVQRQLSATQIGEVKLRPYLTQLCDSLGASMIQDHDRLSIEVFVDESVTNPDVSISLGLIVTELAINALKHAFPAGRHGKIEVDYHSDGAKWKLSVRDNGVGMNPATAKPGLGTGIVEALAKQLQADISVAAAHPGTNVSVVHDASAGADKQASAAA